MQREGKLTYDGLRAVLRWSPTGVVAYKTEGGGWSVKKTTQCSSMSPTSGRAYGKTLTERLRLSRILAHRM